MGSSPENHTALLQLLQQIFTHWVGWCLQLDFQVHWNWYLEQNCS